MSEARNVDGIEVAFADLHAVEQVITMRLAAGGEEARRAERMRVLVRCTAELTRALSTYSRHALVHCQGTAGASDLSADTRWVTDSLVAFCDEIRAVAADYAALTVPTGHELA